MKLVVLTSNLDIMQEPLGILKLAFITIITWMMSILSPIENILWLLLAVFLANIFGGVLTIRIKEEHFSMKKFSEAFLQLLLFGTSIIFMHWLGNVFNDMNIKSNGVKWLTYIIIWGYAVNIFKNAKIMWPKSQTFKVIYNILTIDIFRTIKNQFGLNKLKNKGNVQDKDISTEQGR